MNTTFPLFPDRLFLMNESVTNKLQGRHAIKLNMCNQINLPNSSTDYFSIINHQELISGIEVIEVRLRSNFSSVSSNHPCKNSTK